MRLTKKREDNGRYYLSGLAEVSNRYPKGYGRIQVGHAVEKLAEYEDLEEQGKLLKLPCAVGDTIYTIYSDEDSSFIEESKAVEVSTHRVWIDSAYFDYDDFGKTVFLTREEAEAALKEMERGKGE